MDLEEIQKQMDELEEELRKDSPKYEFFKTKAGKKFEEQFDKLMNFTTTSNLLSHIPVLYVLFSDWLNNLELKSFEKYKDKIENNEELTEDEQEDNRFFYHLDEDRYNEYGVELREEFFRV